MCISCAVPVASMSLALTQIASDIERELVQIHAHSLCSFLCIFKKIADLLQISSHGRKNKMAGERNLLFKLLPLQF